MLTVGLRLPNSIQVEMVSSERVDVLPKERRDVAQCFVIDLLSVGPELANDLPDMNHVPGNHGVVKDR